MIEPNVMNNSDFVVIADDDGQSATKNDKAFELCLSKCVFAGTRPPPIGASTERLNTTKSRGEIIRSCKSDCATNKEQLLIGQPKKTKVSE
eukprot:gene12808-17170_t